jgi:hypothetical protein
MPKFESAWRFNSPGPASSELVGAIDVLVQRVIAQGHGQAAIEHFKVYFAKAGGSTSSYSSNASWASTDLDRYMQTASENEPLFIEAFYDACDALSNDDIDLPPLDLINRTLFDNNSNYEIRPPKLVLRIGHGPIAVDAAIPSIGEQSRQLIEQSFSDSEKLLAEGRPRQAVQEILWLLETVATAFQGMETETGTVEGKYFNKIVIDLKKHHRGTNLDQVLSWITSMHGFLSSPTGCGVRHATDIRSGLKIEDNDARLWCNLIRSYINYLLQEHEKRSK